jgi:hypothetical protein
MARKKKEEFVVRETPERYISDEEVLYIIEKRLLELIKKKPALKAKLKDMFSDVFVEREDMVKILEELRLQRENSDRRFEEINKRFEAIDKRFEKMDRRFEEMLKESNKHREETNKRFEEINKRFEAMDKRFGEMLNELNKQREDTNKRFEAVDRRFEAVDRRFEEVFRELRALREDMNKRFVEMAKEFHNAISSVGGRWGTRAERAFREGIKEILEKYFNAKVREFYIDDKEGIVKGRPARYQVDLLIKDSYHIIIDVKAQANEMDVNKLHKLGLIYEKQKGVKPRLILLTPFAREEAGREAKDVKDVEILTSPKKFKP